MANNFSRVDIWWTPKRRWLLANPNKIVLVKITKHNDDRGTYLEIHNEDYSYNRYATDAYVGDGTIQRALGNREFGFFYAEDRGKALFLRGHAI